MRRKYIFTPFSINWLLAARTHISAHPKIIKWNYDGIFVNQVAACQFCGFVLRLTSVSRKGIKENLSLMSLKALSEIKFRSLRDSKSTKKKCFNHPNRGLSLRNEIIFPSQQSQKFFHVCGTGFFDCQSTFFPFVAARSRLRHSFAALAKRNDFCF